MATNRLQVCAAMAPLPMPPGVYVSETAVKPPTIAGAPTSVAGFVGAARRGPLDTPLRITSFNEYQREFGGLWQPAPLGHALWQFFANGGIEAQVVRVAASDATAATINLGDTLLEATSPGSWGSSLRAVVDAPAAEGQGHFNLLIEVVESPDSRLGGLESEQFNNLSMNPGDGRFIGTALAHSTLARLKTLAPDGACPVAGGYTANADGSDGAALTDAVLIGDQALSSGYHALGSFNLLCLPPLAPGVELQAATWASAAQFCVLRKAMLIIDGPADPAKDPTPALQALGEQLGTAGSNALAYLPWLRSTDPLTAALSDFAPCGAVAGVICATDARRGIWQAPAGPDALLTGVDGFTRQIDDRQNQAFYALGINCLRVLNNQPLVWGARTLCGAAGWSSDWKYLNVRRLALHIEQSLTAGLCDKAVAGNDNRLWSHMGSLAEQFLHGLFTAGAFKGNTPKAAYVVQCDAQTNTAADVQSGAVTLLIGFAPSRPAEFLFFRLQLAVGHKETPS